MELRLLKLVLLCLSALLLNACGGSASEALNPQRPDIESTSSWRLGGQDAPGDPEGVSGMAFNGK